MRVLLRIVKYGWRHKRLTVGAFAAITISTIATMVIPYLLGVAIDEALSGGDRSRLLLFTVVIILTGVLGGGVNYGAFYLSAAASQRVGYDLRNDFLRKLQGLSFGFYDHRQTGDLMSRATVDVDVMRDVISFGLIQGFSGLIRFGFAAAVMIGTNWRLGLIVFALIPIVIWPSIAMALRLRPLFARAYAETGQMNTVVHENLNGMRVVKGFGTGRYEGAKFEKKAATVAGYFYTAGKLSELRQALIAFVFAAATAAILWFGGREVLIGRLTPGELASFFLYMGLLVLPVQMLGVRMQGFAQAIAAGQRFFDVLDAVSPVREASGAKPLSRVRGHIRFEQVSLSYDSAGPAVHDIDFEVRPGQMVAILGGPGAGKSTIVQLIPRFYEVSSGRILVDGVDIRDVTLASLRRNVGIVLQDVFAFSASIRDNISYGLDDASLDDIVKAAQVAQLHSFVEGLPEGYDTWVGERGITLSGGQRQRLAIARTILMDSPILILDDSTSSVDVGTESMIQKAMAEVIKGRTTFVIAHRLSTVRNADLVLVMDQGEIVERGTHRELLAGDGYYRRIHDLQLRPREEIRTLRSEPTPLGDS